ncbi:MAG: hypothetical protein SVN78_02895 [Deferribacterota bacterium]|nr:hypothetical protein [Deferribacterota bacterium]
MAETRKSKNWYYKKLFSDKPEISEMDPEELKLFINNAKKENREIYDFILNRFIEKGRLSEAMFIFDISDIAKQVFK